MPIKRIAAVLGVSPSSVHYWTRDIQLTAEQTRHNLLGPTGPQNAERVAARARSWAKRSRDRRLGWQQQGRTRAGDSDPMHLAGCMLYWAEGAKGRNQLKMANSDPNMMRLFCTFLRSCFELCDKDFTVRINVYTTNGLTIRQIEDYWLELLGLPRSVLRKHTLNHTPTSSSGKKRNKLPYGVCTVTVCKTEIVQHIYGAIQQYGGFEEPRWLDGPPRKAAKLPATVLT